MINLDKNIKNQVKYNFYFIIFYKDVMMKKNYTVKNSINVLYKYMSRKNAFQFKYYKII